MKKMALRVSIALMALYLTLFHSAFAQPAPVYEADAVSSPSPTSASEQATQELPLAPLTTQETALAPDKTIVTATPTQVPVPVAATQNLSVDQRLKRIEQQVANMQNGDAQSHLESLQAQVQTLRGQSELLNHQVEELQKSQKMMYSDLDKRLVIKQPSSSEQPVGTGTSFATSRIPVALKTNIKSSVTASQPDMVEEQKIYQTAYNFIKTKKYNDAVITLQSMLKKYPTGQFASNAHYWLGELFGLLGKHDQALNEFTTVVTSFPDSPRVGDAQLKIGLIYASRTKWPEAKSALKLVVTRFPTTASARLAKEQLKQIMEAGH